jgi:hypothetical protein
MTAMLLKVVPTASELVPLTVEQYHRMIAAGILPEGEPIELLDGLLVRKDRGPDMTTNPLHSLVVSKLTLLLAAALANSRCHVRGQNPITIEPRHEPGPDLALARGRPDDFADRHPGPEDVSCVVEVGDTSLKRDRTLKQRIYVSAGIRQYVLVDLAGRRVEIYEEPERESGCYRLRTVVVAGGSVPLLLPDGRRLELAAADCLP